ncbi:hypothetical protein BDP55DRAFT_629445 [Colletotrichum godetiae]|uniref:Uncharacterized protein n=1 Tax=Colletotrichum godetiae TaxID=1209918 RepID=A0AAJ0AU64_9PEZI|nr:uncharacterized protein BDP55DRAFT_629445 [Colletotrichum godetiae]KAK1688910.1 hypothetical protein BDP55DRAFT_629445 [Colletotrichum godetiae]
MTCQFCGEDQGDTIHVSVVKWHDLPRGIQAGCSRCAFLNKCISAAPFDTQQSDHINVQQGGSCHDWHKGANTSTNIDIFTQDGETPQTRHSSQYSLGDIESWRWWSNPLWPSSVLPPLINHEIGQEENPLQMQKMAAHLPGSTSSETTIRAIKGWLDESSSSHTCRRRNGKHGHQRQALPKRLLQTSHDTVGLQENARQQRHACLSYR